MKKCARHKWSADPPVKDDSFCSECGAVFSGRGRPRKPVVTGDLLVDVAGEITGYVSPPPLAGTGEAVDPTHDQPANEPSVDLTSQEPPKEAPTWCKLAGGQIARAWCLVVEGAAKRFAKRQTAEPEPSTVEELGEAMGDQLGLWFRDSTATPATRIAIAAVMVTSGMVVGSTPLPRATSVGSVPTTGGAAEQPETPAAGAPPSESDVRIASGLY